jgi:hypothetical protein
LGLIYKSNPEKSQTNVCHWPNFPFRRAAQVLTCQQLVTSTRSVPAQGSLQALRHIRRLTINCHSFGEQAETFSLATLRFKQALLEPKFSNSVNFRIWSQSVIAGRKRSYASLVTKGVCTCYCTSISSLLTAFVTLVGPYHAIVKLRA